MDYKKQVTDPTDPDLLIHSGNERKVLEFLIEIGHFAGQATFGLGGHSPESLHDGSMGYIQDVIEMTGKLIVALNEEQ